MTARNDLDQLKAALSDRAEQLLVELFGQPTKRTAREWRWGRKGSIAYRLDRGTFYSFEEGRGGDLLQAIMLRDGCGFSQAITWARAWLGDDTTRPTTPRKKRATFDADAEQQQAQAEAGAMWRAGRRINGTAAEKYLRGRSIEGWPVDSVRMIGLQDVQRIAWRWWRWPAAMFPIVNKAGDVTAVQLVALTDQGQAAKHWEHGGKLKITRGPMAGSALRLAGDAEGPLVLAEGPETALSIWQATGHETWATIGSIARASLDDVPKARAIIVARDDDGTRSPARKALREAITKWRRDGRHVVEAQPWRLSRGDKSDFNDTLQAEGPDAVRERIDAALRSQELPQGKARPGALLELSSAIGRTVSDLLTTVDLADDEPAPFKVISATLGLGKSEAALQAILDAIVSDHRVVYSVPTHKLAADLARRAEAMAAKRARNITVRVWHGREAEDPMQLGQAMCTDLEPVQLAQQARLDVLKTVCDSCEHRAACAYLAQREATADLWLMPHALLFNDTPKAMGGASLLVIDEGFALSGMIGLEGKPTLVHLDTLRGAVTAGNGNAGRSADLNADLAPVRRQLLEALQDHAASEHGEPLQRAPLVAAGLTVDLADQAAKAEGRRRRDVDAITAATRADLLKALRSVRKTNVAAMRAASLWQRIGELLADDGATASGRLDLVETDSGRALRLYGLEKIGKGWRELPTLHLDATADMDLLRLRVPHAELVANVVAAEPHVSVHQVVGRAFGKKALEHGPAADDARRFAVALAAENGGQWLAVASKGAADSWRGNVPPYVELAHWGSVRGLDTYGDVAGVVCIGRWGVGPNDVGRMAAILTGRAVPRLEGWYPVEAVTVTAADGSSRTIDADRHPDATAEAVRTALVTAELLQAIGRGRGVQRTAGNPLAVYVLGNTPLPLPLASISDWQPVDLDRAMLADHGAVLSSADDAAMVLGKTRNAVKAARQGRLESCPYKNYLFGQDSNLPAELTAVTYQRKGPGRAEQRAVYDPRRIADPRAWLEAHIGPLVHFEADDQTDLPAMAETVPAGKFFGSLKGDDLAAVGVSAQYAREGDGFAAISDGTATAADPWADYNGGIMPDHVRYQVRDRWRAAAGMTQDDLARRVGISRPQLANALQGRFGLSADAAARLRAVVVSLPLTQGSLL